MTRERNALLDRLDQALPPRVDAFDRLSDRRDRKTMRRRTGGTVVGVGLTAAIVTAMFAGGPLRENERSSPLKLASSPVPLVAEPGQYYYVRIVSYGGVTTTNERWFSPDGSGRFTTHIGGELLHDRSFSPGQLTEKLYTGLSTDPEVLIAQLLDRSASGGASPISVPTPAQASGERLMVLLAMDSLLEFGSDYLVPEQVAAVFRAAAGMDGVMTATGKMDPAGREPTVLRWTIDDGDGSMMVEWFFDPSTQQYMGQRRIDLETSQAFSVQTIEVAGIVDSTDDRPSPKASYVPEGTAEPDLQLADDPAAPQSSPA